MVAFCAMGDADLSILGAIFGKAECSAAFHCTLWIDTYGSLLWVVVMVMMFKWLGVLCKDYPVRALEEIKTRFGLSDDIAGATLFAPGSSAPELFTNLVATLIIVSQGGVGAVIGSLVYNMCIMVGASCMVAPHPLKIQKGLVIRDTLVFFVAVFQLAIFLRDDVIVWWEGLIMVGTYIAYTISLRCSSTILSTSVLKRRARVGPTHISEGNSQCTPVGAVAQKATNLGNVSLDPVWSFAEDPSLQKLSLNVIDMTNDFIVCLGRNEYAADVTTIAKPSSKDVDSASRIPSDGEFVEHADNPIVSVGEAWPESCTLAEGATVKVGKTWVKCRDPMSWIWQQVMPSAKCCFLLLGMERVTS